ncbi:MAG: hypothetical protein ACREQY_15910, partial [Candidatus Binatia bacterium]
VLYELLTGSLPHDPQKLREAGWLGMMRMLREDEPKKASTQVSNFNEERASAVANQRRTEPKSLRRSLEGDLDWILLKSLDKERDQRYPNVSDLAADLERHLQSEPVAASPPSAAYRARKFVRRHRWGVAASLGLFLALSAGIAVSTAFFVSARDSRQRAEFEAERNRIEGSFLSSLMQDDVKLAGEAFDKFLAFQAAATPDPDVLAGIAARDYTFLQVTFCMASCGEEAQESLEPRLELAIQHIVPALSSFSRETAHSVLLLSMLANANGLDPDGARLEPLVRAGLNALPTDDKLAGEDTRAEATALLPTLLLRRGTTALDANRVADAARFAQESVDLARALPAGTWRDPKFDALWLLARTKVETGDVASARALLEEACAIRAAQYGEEFDATIECRKSAEEILAKPTAGAGAPSS